MKKLLLFLVMFFMGCNIQPTQIQPNLAEEIAGLQDIPLTNMPGHEPPECPLECLCPSWFGLSESPCAKPAPTAQPAPEFRWYRELELRDAMIVAGDYDKLLLIVMIDVEDKFTMQLFERLAAQLDNDKCTREEIERHYIPVIVSRPTYDVLRKTKNLGWLPDDYFMSPAMMFATVKKKGNNYLGEVLPVTFEGRVDVDTCNLLQSFYGATR